MSERVVTEPTTVRHHVGQCPGCRSGIYAEVDVVTTVHPARLDSDGKPQHCAHASVVSARLEHSCARHVDGEWTDGDLR